MKRRIGLLLILAIVLAGFIFSNSFIRSENYSDVWWNSSWHYRIRLDINTSGENRTDWPVEYDINFTYLLQNMSESGTLDNLSLRLVEYNLTDGSVMHELPVQFDPDGNYNSSESATGEVIFILNGTTWYNESKDRNFYLYFDTVENGPKGERTWDFSDLGYNISYTWNGDSFTINNTNYLFYFDTNRGENTSGLYRLYDIVYEEEQFIYSTSGQRTREYLRFTNGSHNFTWDINASADFVIGPARITVTQTGDEAYWSNIDNKTNETSIVKKYHFYPQIPWYRMEFNITNTGDHSVNRSSDVGAPGFDASLAYSSNYNIFNINSTDPFSWITVTYSSASNIMGIILENESGTSSFYADNSTASGRVGVRLDPQETLAINSSIWARTVFVASHSARSPSLVTNIRSNIQDVTEIVTSAAEKWVVKSEPQANYTIYNRNETVLIWVNITLDGWDITNHTNATLDMGTPSTADDVTIVLYDDGNSAHGDTAASDGIWSNLYILPNDSATGGWNYTARIYDSDGHQLNETYHTFNVTAQFYTSLVILNPSGLPDREVNATLWVKNYRQDTNITDIPADDINCTYYHSETPGDKTQIDNITVNGDGSYSINFTVPSELGLYYMNCTAEKDGNNGTDYDNFAIEAPTTNASVETAPPYKVLTNVTWYDNESFILTVTMNNLANASAYKTNITLEVPSGFSSNETFYQCNDVLIDLTCVRHFNLTALAATSNDTYEFNITINWTNPDNSTDYNYTLFDVIVAQNPIMLVDTDNLSARVGPGFEKQMGTININSTGNYRIEDVNFTVTGLDGFQFIFSPPGPISYISPGTDQDVTVTVNVSSDQEPGLYNGTLNVSTSNDGFHIINLSVIVSGTNVSITASPQNHTADNVTWYNGESFNLTVNTTNMGAVTSFDTLINLSMNLDYFNATGGTEYACGNVSVNNSCNVTYNVTVLNGTPAGNYTINVTVSWEEVDLGTIYNWTLVNVTVTSNVSLELDKENVTGSLEHGISGTFGNITLLSAGNDVVENITLNLTGLETLSAVLSSEGPVNLSTGQNQTIYINATIPFAYPAGTYNGTLNITTNNAGNFSLNVSLVIPVNGSWYVNQTLCEHSQTPDIGVACTVLVNNTGNVPLNFTVTPSEANHTNVSTTSFNLDTNQEYDLIFYYNVSGIAGQSTWSANYTLDATNAYAEPDEVDIGIYLNPYINPIVDIGVVPDTIQQLGSFSIYSNVTIQSDRPIQFVQATVMRPDGTNNTINLTQWWPHIDCAGSGAGSKSCWYTLYPSTWGNTTMLGNYTVWVYAEDDLGVNETNNASVYAYTKLQPIMFTLNDEYSNLGYQGSVYYQAKDVSLYYNIENVTAVFNIFNPSNETVFNRTYSTHSDGFIRNDYGGIYMDFPTYGYPTGNYTVSVNSTYYDQQAGVFVYSLDNHTFTMVDYPPSYGIHADMRIYPLWYQNSIMKFVMWFTDSAGMLTDPDNINLLITDPAGNPYFTTTMASMTRESTGVYTYNYAMPVNSAIGIYDVAMNATIGGYYTVAYDYIRVSMGGPYDVIVNLLEYEVDVGDFLDFELYVENMGDVDNEDVLIEYWVTGESQTWDYQQLSANIRAAENKTFTRNAFIFSQQPSGTYILNVKVTYDTVHNLYATANATFTVTGEEGPEEPSSPPSGDEGGAPPSGPGGGGGEAKLEITDYEKEVGVQVGVARYINIAVKNTGDASATDVVMKARSSNDDWFVFEPKIVETLSAGKETVFTLKILVPSGVPSGQYEIMLIASSDESETSEVFKLFVFTSRKDLLEFELVRLRARLKELKSETDNAAEMGYDVSDVEDIIDDIEKEIELAENYMSKELYDAALDSVYKAWRLIEEAEDLLEKIMSQEQIPLWMLILVAFIAVIAILVFFLRRMMKNMRILTRGRLSEARQAAGIAMGSSSVDRLKAERAKTERMIRLLEGQYRAGIISKEAYESMKKRSEGKIRDLDKKIRKSLKI